MPPRRREEAPDAGRSAQLTRAARVRADRDGVIELLRAAVADGRLDPAEFDERLDAALAARTIDALAPLTADLIAAPDADELVLRALQAGSAGFLLKDSPPADIVRAIQAVHVGDGTLSPGSPAASSP